MRLWTFQSIKSVQELESTGELFVKWDRYQDDRWKAAYQWMSKQMKKNGIDCAAFAPIWAWHSCGEIGAAPTLTDARYLLSDIELENGIKTIELECPTEIVLLSNYSVWTELLDLFLVDKTQQKIDKKLVNQLFDTQPENFRPYDSIQATLAVLKKEWVIDIRPLELKPNDFSFPKNKAV